MICEIRVPKLGMSQADVTVIEVSRKDGETVERDETVMVIETSKVSYEIKAPAAGLIFYLKRRKDKVGVGFLLAVISDTPETFYTFREKLPREAGAVQEPLFSDEKEEWGVRISFDGTDGTTRSPVRPPAVSEAKIGDRNVLRRIPFIGMRRTIADNLWGSLQTGAQLTVFSDTDFTEMMAYRGELMLDYPDTRITLVEMLVKILAFVLKEFPLLNATVIGDEIVCWGEYNIGVAVALDQGLVVPVIRNADKKGVVGISREIKKLAGKAREGRLEPAAFEGGTFTLSSGGRVETDFMTPIINPPQSAILGLGKIGPRPAVHHGQLAVRTMGYLCLTHDHRVVDGVPASLFLSRLKEIIEDRKHFGRVLK